MITVGGSLASRRREACVPSILVSSSRNDFHHLLTGGERRQDLFALGFFFDLLDELFDYFEVDIGFEQGDSGFRATLHPCWRR